MPQKIAMSCAVLLCVPSLALAFLAFFSSAENPTTFIFNKLKETDLILMQDASIQSNVLRLTENSPRMMGRALYPSPLQMKANKNKWVSSFSTTFVFSIVPPRHGSHVGHGLTFLASPYKFPVNASDGGYLGLLNHSTDGSVDNHLFAVEFDTNLNHWNNDIDGNHVGVDLNSINSSQSKPAGLNLTSGHNIQAWIDYDRHQDNLRVTVALAGMARPLEPLISMKNVSTDLAYIFREEMYVGFSASTGKKGVEENCILAWSFSNEGMAPSLNLSHLPSFTHDKNSNHKSAGIIVGYSAPLFILVLLAGVVVYCWWKRRRGKEKDVIEEWELEYWPHRFPYEELRMATQGFRNEQLLGRGGFGKVYRGILHSTGVEVAIKCITKDFSEGLKEFIAEISSLGRLQHRNLVQLRGWCRKKNQLCLVYDYMPNGSLDRMIFGNPNEILGWPQRYAILKGVAAGLLYLHQGWDRRVVHRDLKSSNVLLDSNFNPKLGDFGLARLYEHSENPQTSGVAGTRGYIAPELAGTGKATASTDVFSFGIVLLEVASGRRPLDISRADNEIILLEWVRQLYKEERIMDAMDPKLGGAYDAEEAQRVLMLGLLCSHSQPECRPNTRQALEILENGGEISFPFPIPWEPPESPTSWMSISRTLTLEFK